MDIKQLKREFVIEKGNKQLADPDPTMSPDKVMAYYSNQFPELVNAHVRGPEVLTNKLKFKFVTGVGTKG